LLQAIEMILMIMMGVAIANEMMPTLFSLATPPYRL